MPFAASLSEQTDTRAALESVVSDVLQQLDGQTPDLAFAFVTHDHADAFDEIPGEIVKRLPCKHLLGCAAESVAGGGREVEREPAVSLWAAVLPGAQLESFHVTWERTPDGLACAGFPAAGPSSPPVRAAFLLGDPFSCAGDDFIERLGEDFPGVPLFGGMASGGGGPGMNRLFYQGETLDHGGVGVLIRGGPPIRSLVSQGCRPIGTPFVVTKADENVVFQLGGKPALERLREMFGTLDERDRALMQRGLHLGLAMNEYQDKFERGDFLIANVLGFDQQSGALAVGNYVRTGQTVQFHVRDADTADDELRHLLGRHREEHPQIAAALLFTCNGRGSRLFGKPHHDAGAVQSVCGKVPLAGFFAQGELGPVGGKNYMHGFTASAALFT